MKKKNDKGSSPTSGLESFYKSLATSEFCRNFGLIVFFYRHNLQNYHRTSKKFSLKSVLAVIRKSGAKKLVNVKNYQILLQIIKPAWFLSKRRLFTTLGLNDAHPAAL